MKTRKNIILNLKTLCIIFSMLLAVSAFSQSAKEYVQKADEKFRGSSNISEMTMKIVRPKWTREVTMKSWAKGEEYSMVVIQSPAADKGQTFLKRGKDLWNWQPKINRMIKMPPSMMSQGWMGSDITNDDLMRQSSLVSDYKHTIVGEETVDGHSCARIELIPLPDADIVWGKINMWITKDSYLMMKSEYYDEDMYLVHTENGKDVKNLGGREIPSVLEIIPADEPDNKTVLIFNSIQFDVQLDETFFSQQRMKQLR